ncbi:hypothetical protein ACFSPU_06610 [Haoranjiania flava]|uniref:Uncharacterized protein n=1 Tax=Haoranjiania flava TaxID=1856322 RepID=A0AAE3IP24_9BACT|nr:hypothetical protein [Haoranjiania flava]MCU7695602.1 hypothetical protein [Haoranjiania flava]
MSCRVPHKLFLDYKSPDMASGLQIPKSDKSVIIGLLESNARLSVRGSNARKVIDSPERGYRL